MEINNIFPTPILMDTIDSVDVKLIENHCYDCMNTSQSRIVSNRGQNSYQSFSLYPKFEFNSEMNKLLEEIYSRFNLFSKELGIHDDMNIGNYWINVNGKHSYNVDHDHPGSILSAVFYVKTPENSGQICFFNPASRLIDSYMVGKKIDYESNFGTLSPIFKVSPKENQLLLFPSWIVHRVDPNESDHDRISIAFNFL